MTRETGPTKQTRETARKAAQIRTLRKHGRTWEESARKAGILKEDGSPDPGLAYKIAVEGYEPKRPQVRERLGLRKVCLSCMRGFRKSVSSGAKSLPPWVAFWRRLPREERDKRIREVWEKEGKR